MPLCKLEKEMVAKGKESKIILLCALTTPTKPPIKNVHEQASYNIGKLGKIIQGQIVKAFVTLMGLSFHLGTHA